MSSQGPNFAKSIYDGIYSLWPPSLYPAVVAVTTIVFSLILLRDNGASRWGQPQFVRNSIPLPVRPQPVDQSLDELPPGTLVLSQATLGQRRLGDRDARNKKTAPDSKLSLLSAVPHSGHHGIPTLPEVSLVTPSVDHGDVQAVDEEHLDISSSKEAQHITKEPRSVNNEDRIVQIEEGSSMLEVSNTSNQMPPTPNTRVDTRGGAYFQNATFSKGVYALGSNNILYNICFGNGPFTDDQKEFIREHIANPTVLLNIDNDLKKHDLILSIVSLPRAEAAFNDYQNETESGPCFKGTRVALLQKMADWITDSSKSGMYVLSGLAGIGKSTVAYTIASQAHDLNILGASFFFSRNVLDRKNAQKLFTTIARQLCLYNEEFSNVIGKALMKPSGVAASTKSPQEQLRVLILEPLKSIISSRARPVLIVVDALDECDEVDRKKVVMGLTELVQLLPSFKVILTTRPQSPDIDLLGDYVQFRLRDIKDEVVDGDIRLYLKHELSSEQVKKLLPRQEWFASDENIDSLVRIAGRLFIIASTAVRYILDKHAYAPAVQMRTLLAFDQGHTLSTNLDCFYTVILRAVVPAECNNPNVISRYRSVVGAIIFVQRPLPVSTLACLIGIDANEIFWMLDNLQSVILLGEDKVPRIYNQSFPDYLIQSHCKDFNLRIDPGIGHTHIATRCLMIMNELLKYNILSLSNLARFMNNKDGREEDKITSEHVQEKIPPQLEYACVHWANHIKVANIENAALMKGLEMFVEKHILHWFEVLSLVGQLGSAHHAIGVVLKLLKLTSNSKSILEDALRFISRFYEVIEQSALHTYYSALAFTPTNSCLYHQYLKEALYNICNITGGPEEWGALVASLPHEEHVKVIKFSPDSTQLVSCSEEYHSVDDRLRNQGKLKIWDAATGTPKFTIPSHRSAVANNFSMITSSEDKTVKFYVNGSAQSVAFPTSSKIEKLALSSESSRVAAALSDGTIWLWDSGDAKSIIKKFDGFESEGQLKFSPAGTRLAFSSTNGIVKLQDGISGKSIADLQCGSRRDNPYFEFLGDGSQIVSLSHAHELKLWGSETGKLVDAVRSIADWCVLAISANESLLATASDDQVYLWSVKRDNLAQIGVLKTRFTLSMAFSLDGKLAIATGHRIVRLYDVRTLSFIFSPTLWFSGSPTALAFSPDSTRLAVGNKQGIVYLWNIQEIEVSNLPSTTPATSFPQLALSPDCSRLACGFYTGAVELRRTDPEKERNAPLAPSRNGLHTILFNIYPQSRRYHTDTVTTLGFGPDGSLFASGSRDGIIKLWNGEDGALRGTLQVPIGLQAVALSNNRLVAAGAGRVTLWSLDTLSLIRTFQKSGDIASTVSISGDSTLIAVAFRDSGISLWDVVNHKTITTIHVSGAIHTMAFLPDNSLVAQFYEGTFLLIDKNGPNLDRPTLEHLIQLPNILFWRGAPVWYCCDKEQHYFAALLSRDKSSVPLLRIPREIHVMQCTQRSSMVALGCKDGRVILLRPPTVD